MTDFRTDWQNAAGQPECSHAPRHKPAHTGHCTRCGQPIPEPWYMRRRPDAATLVAEIAARHGATVPQHVAREIAEAMLSYADAAIEIRRELPRQAWAEEGYRAHVRDSMRRQLLDEVAKQGRIPAALPSEAIRYLAAPLLFVDQDRESGEVPAELVKQGAPYEMVQLILAVQVRTPPVDRAAAVRAGVL